MCGRDMRYCGNTADLVTHMRFHHNKDYEEKSAATVRRDTMCVFGADRHLPGTEKQ